MSDELDTMTDFQIDGIFAVEIAGWTQRTEGMFWSESEHQAKILRGSALHETRLKMRLPCEGILLDFCADANAVLPWLENTCWRGTSLRVGKTSAATVTVLAGENLDIEITARSLDRSNDFCRAACIALIRAKRAHP